MKRSVIAFMAALLVLTTFTVAAQEQTGAIEGTIRDSSGAVVPGVTVEATSSGSGTLTSVTDSRGMYRFPRLQSGRYSISASLMGYKPAGANNVEITLGNAGPEPSLRGRRRQGLPCL